MIKLTQKVMSIKDWINVPSCPIQRNTEVHAKKARNNHLKLSSPTHARVSAASLPSGKVFKLDGHTRALLWEDGSLTPSFDRVQVDMFLVDNVEQVKELYKQFDSQGAAEGAIDRLYGAYRLHGFNPESKLAKSGGITSAVRICLRKVGGEFNIYEGIAPFIPAMETIDSEMFSLRLFPTGVLAAMIATVYRFDKEAMDFWITYHNGEGSKIGRERDAVQVLTDAVQSYRNNGKINTGGTAVAMKVLCGKAISAFHSHQKNRTYIGGIKSIDLSKYLDSHIIAEPCNYNKVIQLVE